MVRLSAFLVVVAACNGEIDQGATVAIDLATRRVTIDSRASIDVLAAAIDEAGYPVLSRA